MKFGKEFNTHLEQTLPEWRDKFLCYKPLKKILKNFPIAADPSRDFLEPHQWPLVEDGAGGGSPAPIVGRHEIDVPSLVDLQEWFLRILNEELEKFNDFYVDKEEEFVIRFQELKQRIEQVKEQSSRDGVFTSEAEFSEEMMDIRKDFVAFHGEMVLLKNYSSLNFAGLIKILKKYDKRTGELLRLPFTQQAVHQPFFTTEPLTRLVRECEANLELLFPLEAEVVESTPTGEAPSNSSTVLSTETPSNLGEDTMNLYRGTIAAMSAIRGLQKESSTSNPLSFSSLFRCRDDESTGALTDEHSPTNSSDTSRNEVEVEKEEDSHSV